MRLLIDERVEKFILDLEVRDQDRVVRYFEHFKEYGFNLPPSYLKKVGKQLWELRPGNVRIFLHIKGDTGIAVHGIVKKTKKISKKDFDLAESRVKEIR